jgi:hypothetical protein
MATTPRLSVRELHARHNTVAIGLDRFYDAVTALEEVMGTPGHLIPSSQCRADVLLEEMAAACELVRAGLPKSTFEVSDDSSLHCFGVVMMDSDFGAGGRRV